MVGTRTAVLLAARTFAAQAAADINKASRAELERVKGIGPAMSERVLDERKKSEVRDWSDAIVRVKGVGEGNAARLSAGGLTVGASPDAGKDMAAAAPSAATTSARAEPKR